MIHYVEGQVGHFFVVLAFVASLVSCISFFLGTKKDSGWESYATKAFYLHVIAVAGIVCTLFYLIHNHYFEYHYVFSHSSLLLPSYYQISCFWEGQEGSFLLWTFWNAVLGIVLMKTNKAWKAPVMFVMSLVQVFLTSMILGVVIFDIKIGSSPFILLRDAVSAPIFQSNPNFIPEDGNGLNPLLQNYWMVIHPPTLFLGFATTAIPFAYCIGGLMTGRSKEWIRPALPWAQFSAMVLGVGILMGAYWAYETLNFGGYWNWDPVENAIYVPWLVLVAAIHVMIAYKKSGSALKTSLILVVATFILVLYATFLTRSGILGNSSVHSFTDLGLSGQLLLFLLGFLLLSVVLIVRSWSSIPTSKNELATYSREFWILAGAIALCLMAFQVFFNMSYPVFNILAQLFGFESNAAPNPNTYKSYSLPQLAFAILVVLLSGTGQFFWWKKMDRQKLKKEIIVPVLLAIVTCGIIVMLMRTELFRPFQDKIAKKEFAGVITALSLYILVLLGSIYSIFANLKIFISVAGSNLKLTGGAITHVGVALMLIGILFSSGYEEIQSRNYTGRIWNKGLPDDVNQDNLLLFINTPRQMGEFSMIYRGKRKYSQEEGMVNNDELIQTPFPLKFVHKRSNDTLTLVNPENTYFEVEYFKGEEKKFTLFPRVQINRTMDMTVYSPDVQKSLDADLYTHVRIFSKNSEKEWSNTSELKVSPGEQFFINDYVATLEKLITIKDIDGEPVSPSDIAVKAVVNVQGEYRDYACEPIFIIKNGEYVGRINDEVPDLAFRLSVQSILPEENKVVFSMQTTQKEWIILEARKKPWINLLWLGTLTLVVGFCVAISRRYSEFMKMRDKGQEV